MVHTWACMAWPKHGPLFFKILMGCVTRRSPQIFHNKKDVSLVSADDTSLGKPKTWLLWWPGKHDPSFFSAQNLIFNPCFTQKT